MGYRIETYRFGDNNPTVTEDESVGQAQLQASQAQHDGHVKQITIRSERDHIVFTGYRAAQAMSLQIGQDDLRPPRTGPPASRLKLGRAGETPSNAL